MVRALDQREAELAVVELLDVRATALAGSDRLDLDDLCRSVGGEWTMEGEIC